MNTVIELDVSLCLPTKNGVKLGVGRLPEESCIMNGGAVLSEGETGWSVFPDWLSA